MVIWKKPADPATAVDRCFLEYGKAEDHPYAYSYRKADGAEFALARLHRETGIGELEIRPRQLYADAPWLRISRADLGAIDRLLGLDPGEERETDHAVFEAKGRSEEDACFLVVVNAIRNLMRAHPAYEQFLLTEGARVKKGTDLFVKKLCRLRYNSRHRRVS